MVLCTTLRRSIVLLTLCLFGNGCFFLGASSSRLDLPSSGQPVSFAPGAGPAAHDPAAQIGPGPGDVYRKFFAAHQRTMGECPTQGIDHYSLVTIKTEVERTWKFFESLGFKKVADRPFDELDNGAFGRWYILPERNASYRPLMHLIGREKELVEPQTMHSAAVKTALAKNPRERADAEEDRVALEMTNHWKVPVSRKTWCKLRILGEKWLLETQHVEGAEKNQITACVEKLEPEQMRDFDIWLQTPGAGDLIGVHPFDFDERVEITRAVQKRENYDPVALYEHMGFKGLSDTEQHQPRTSFLGQVDRGQQERPSSVKLTTSVLGQQEERQYRYQLPGQEHVVLNLVPVDLDVFKIETSYPQEAVSRFNLNHLAIRVPNFWGVKEKLIDSEHNPRALLNVIPLSQKDAVVHQIFYTDDHHEEAGEQLFGFANWVEICECSPQPRFKFLQKIVNKENGRRAIVLKDSAGMAGKGGRSFPPETDAQYRGLIQISRELDNLRGINGSDGRSFDPNPTWEPRQEWFALDEESGGESSTASGGPLSTYASSSADEDEDE